MSVIMLLLACYGVCFTLINKAKFLRRISFFDKMFDCVFCTGFHAGWITHLLAVSFYLQTSIDYADIFIMAFSSASFCYTLDTAIIYLEYKTAQLKGGNNNTLLG